MFSKLVDFFKQATNPLSSCISQSNSQNPDFNKKDSKNNQNFLKEIPSKKIINIPLKKTVNLLN